MKTAYLVRDLEPAATGAKHKLYHLSDRDLSETGYVVVSAGVALYTGPETYIFPADEKGNILDYGQLDGSVRGTLFHHEALEAAGYTVTTEEVVYCAPARNPEKIPILEPVFIVDPEPEDTP